MFALASLSLLLGAPVLFVGMDGDDSGPGTRERPLATLGSAAARSSANGQIVVLAGRYEVKETVRLGPRHRGLRIAGEAGAVLTGSRELMPRMPDPSLAARVPTDARDRIRQVDLPLVVPPIEPRGFSRRAASGPVELMVNGQAQTLARWPNQGFLRTGSVLEPGDVPREERNQGRRPRFLVDTDRPATWGSQEIWAYGYWKWDWADESLPVAQINGREIQLGQPHHYGVDPGKPFYFENVLEELDRAGEYWIDPSGRRMIVWPTRTPARFEVSVLDRPLIEIEGGTDIRIENLEFENGRREGVRLEGGNRVRIEHCRFRNFGRYPVLIRNGNGHRIGESVFEELAAGGIDVAGGDRKTLTPSAHRIENCLFRDYMRLSRTYRPAVLIGGVGVAVRQCEFRDAPHSAIIFSGNDHLIEGNAFVDLLNETGDGGAVYGGRDWSARGTVIRENLFFHLRGLKLYENGVYLDDQISGITVERNAFVDCFWGLMVGGGRDNVVSDNLFAGCTLAMALDARGLGWAKDSLATMKENLQAVPFQSGRWKERYPELARILSDEPMSPIGNLVRGNLLIQSGSIRDRVEAAFERDSTLADNRSRGEPFAAAYRDGQLMIAAETERRFSADPVFMHFAARNWKFGPKDRSKVGPDAQVR